MIKLQQNRYLWVHFAGLAVVPLLLDICLAGLASAGPALPFKGQFWVIALLGIIPGLAMQWLKPFYVFSLPPSALKPAALSEDQRRCLQIFKSWQIKALAIVVAAFLLWLLVQLYTLSPLISPILTPRAGLISAAIAFFIAATFTQISVSAARALLIGPDALKRVPACEESAIARDFLIAGIRVKQLLPDIYEQPSKPKVDNPDNIVTQPYQSPAAKVNPVSSAVEADSSRDADSTGKTDTEIAADAENAVTAEVVVDLEDTATAEIAVDSEEIAADLEEVAANLEDTAATEDAVNIEDTATTEDAANVENTGSTETGVDIKDTADAETVVPEKLPAETIEAVPVADESATGEST